VFQPMITGVPSSIEAEMLKAIQDKGLINGILGNKALASKFIGLQAFRQGLGGQSADTRGRQQSFPQGR